MPKDAFNKLQDTGKYKADGNRVLVAGAGRVDNETFSRNKNWEADFYFDAFKMTSVIGHNSKNKGTNSLEMSFTIIEPYGISFLDRLINTCEDEKIKNYMSVPYIIQLDFFGYSDKTIQGNEPYNPVKIPEGTRIFPIRLLSMSIAFDQKGTTYNFTAVPYNHSALSELNITLPTTTTIRAGGARLLTDFFSMNDAEVDSLSSTRGGATKERRDKAIADMVVERQKEIDKYNKDLPELQKKYEAELSRQAATSRQNTSGSGTVPVATKPMQPPPTPLTTETATVEYDKKNSNNIAKPTETHATGLATVLNEYNKFLQKEYGLVGPPIIYKFSFLPPIDKATIGDPGRLPGDTAPMETKKPVEQNSETLRPGVQPSAVVAGQPLAANIAKFESGGAGYNAYNKGTVNNIIIGSDKQIDLSSITIEEYFRKSRLPMNDPDRLFAVGKYQIIPGTMGDAVKSLSLDPKTTYLTPSTQETIFGQQFPACPKWLHIVSCCNRCMTGNLQQSISGHLRAWSLVPL